MTIYLNWYWKQSNGEDFDAPNNFLIKVLQDNWHPYKWDDKWMKNQMFNSEGIKW